MYTSSQQVVTSYITHIHIIQVKLEIRKGEVNCYVSHSYTYSVISNSLKKISDTCLCVECFSNQIRIIRQEIFVFVLHEHILLHTALN